MNEVLMPFEADDERSAQWLRGALGLAAEHNAFPWQLGLLRHFLRGDKIQALDIPTGLGKTATMAVWLVARAVGAPLPRRLVYVVDRRAVVDQATDVAVGLRDWVAGEPPVAKQLGLRDRPLPISTLRGQFVDNREWLEDPSAPAIVVGTVDMVGSRLLFSGYGVSTKMRPYHAGLLGADTLVVLDEAHLVPAFEDLLRQVEDGADAFGPKDPSLRGLIPRFTLLSLSATGRETRSESMTLTDADHRDPVVSKRLNAKKSLSVVELATMAEANDANEDGESGSAEADDANKKSEDPKLADVLAKQAWELTHQGSANVRCLVFCNARKDATAVAAELRNLAKSASATEPTVELFVGARRVRERTQARETLVQLGFLPMKESDGPETFVRPERAVFLIATSAGEVGVDLDADHMVCDLVAWERMVQRLGRVNRRGDGNAKVVVVTESEPAPADGVKKALDKRDAAVNAEAERQKLMSRMESLRAEKEVKAALARSQMRINAFKDADAKVVARHEAEVAQYRALRKLLEAVGEDGSLSPAALLELRNRPGLANALRDAASVEPLRPELTRALVDAWSLTSLDEHPGRPDVGPWLRGFRPDDRPQTTLVWRRRLPVRNDRPFDPKAAKHFFAAAPPHTSEQLETETHLALDWLIKRSEAADNAGPEEVPVSSGCIVAIALTSRGEVKDFRTIEQLRAAASKGKKGVASKDAKKAREQLEQLLIGATLIVDARLAGLTYGLLDSTDSATPEVADDTSAAWLARPDVPDVPVTGFRVRYLQTGEREDAAPTWRTAPGNGWVRRHVFVTDEVDGEPSAVLVIDGWAGDAATEDERAEANRPQRLEEHQSWADACARGIAQRLGLDENYEDILALAARLHDEGKRAARWQRAFKAPVDGRPYAKTRGPIDFDILDSYRHELGSLPYVEQHAEFLELPQDDRELVLHLVAAHHGYARPVIGTSGCDDAPPSIVEERARRIALRFARLSRRWGPWGLAWWEALLRAADQAASRRNQQAVALSAQKQKKQA